MFTVEGRAVFKSLSIVCLILLMAYNFLASANEDTRTEAIVTFVMLMPALFYVCNV